MIIKLDIANSFDHVSHYFIFKVLARFGFGSSFIQWISSCISAPWITPLISGKPIAFFQGSKAVRQGYPLSPLLYNIMVDSLSRKLEAECINGNLPRIKIVRGTKSLNHSRFTDDTLLPGGASIIIVNRFNRTLDSFLLASRGVFNRQKCQIFS
jgi:hypothetical protein